MIKHAATWFVGLVALALGFTATAHAANAVDPADGSLDLARSVYDAIHGGHYWLAAAIALVAAVALVRKYGGARWKWMHTDAGSAALVLGGAFGAALIASLSGGGPMTLALAEHTGMLAFFAAGGYAALNKLVVEPLLQPLAKKLPTWAAVPLQAVIYFFEHKSDPSTPSASPSAPAQAPSPTPAAPPTTN